MAITGAVDRLTIEIRTDGAEQAVRTLDGLRQSLAAFREVSNTMTGRAGKDTEKTADSMNSAGQAASKTTVEYSALGKVLDRLGTSMLNTSQRLYNLALQTSHGTAMIGRFARGFSNLGVSLKTTAANAKRINFTHMFNAMGAALKKNVEHLHGFLAALKRIAMYRFLRSLIKAITQAVKEGVTNIYNYSKIVGTSLAPALDKAKSASLTFKNSIGAALAPVIEAFVPVLQKVCTWLTKFNNLLASLFAALAGKDTYTAAVDTFTTWGEEAKNTTGAVKELKRQLMGFDELNVLNDHNSGGGGSGSSTPDYASMFEERAVPNALADWASQLRLVFNDVVLDWSNLNQEQTAEKIISGIFTFCGLIFGGIGGALLGFTLSLLVNKALFDGDGNISKQEWMKLTKGIFGAIGGAFAGFFIGGVPGLLVGASLGFAFNVLTDKITLDDDGTTLGDILFTPSAVKVAWEKLCKWWDENVHPWREKEKKIWSEDPIFGSVSQVFGDIKKAFKDATDYIAGFFMGDDDQFSIENIFPFVKVGEGFNSLPEEIKTSLNNAKSNLTSGWNKITSWWSTTASPKLSSIWDTIDGFWNDFIDAPQTAYNTVFDTVTTEGVKIATSVWETLRDIPTNAFSIWDQMSTQAPVVWEEIRSKIGGKAEETKQSVITAFQNLPSKISGIWEQVKSFFKDPFAGVNADEKARDLKDRVVGAFQNMPTNIAGYWQMAKQVINSGLDGTTIGSKAEEIKNKVSEAFANMKKSVTDAFDKMRENIKKPINGIIEFINKMIFGIVSGMNKVISKLNSLSITLPSWLPFFGGQSLSFNIKNLGYPPQITYLAGGGVVQTGQLFVARERGAELIGTANGHTAVMNNDQIVESVSEGVYRAVKEAMGEQYTTINVDGRQLFEIVTERNNAQVKRTGRSPLLV